MVELTDREKKIIHIKFIMHGEKLQKLPINVRETMLIMTLKLRGIEYDKNEMLDIGQAIIDEQGMIEKKGMGFLDKHGKGIAARLKGFGKLD